MRLVSFTYNKTTRIGALSPDAGDAVVDFSTDASLPDTMQALLEAGDDAMARARKAADSRSATIPLSDVELCAPVLRPPKILAVALNYKAHAAEAGMKPPPQPIIFNKQSTSTTGPYAPVLVPGESEQIDYEGELGVYIGTRCRRVPKARAYEVVAGYTIVNDVSVRDWQFQAPTMMMGKSWDTHCPAGPALVSKDEIPDPQTLSLRTLVNGEERQKANTDDLIFSVPTLIEHLSTAFTLEPGDLIATGTCSGVAVAMEGQPWLKAGDIVRVEIEKLGYIENTMTADTGGVVIG